MNARTHEAYLKPDLWRALWHVATVRGLTLEEVLDEIAWIGLREAYPSFPLRSVIDAEAVRKEWLKRHDAEVRDTIKRAIESKVKACE